MKIKAGGLYKLPSGVAVRVVRKDWSKNIVIVHNYSSHSNEAMDYSAAMETFVPLLRIGEVAKLLGKKASTIRKYENQGLLPEVEKISLNREGKRTTRVYTPKDIEAIVDFFNRRKPVGRPGPVNVGGINRKVVMERFTASYFKDKNYG